MKKGEIHALLGENGAGKSTFLKVLSGELEPSKGEVTMEKGERLSVLKQDHFAYEEHTVIDTVIMGNQELYKIMQDKNEIYGFARKTKEETIVVIMNMGEKEQKITIPGAKHQWLDAFSDEKQDGNQIVCKGMSGIILRKM